MSFDFTPVKAFLSAEIASIDGFRAKLVQVLSFFPDSSDQLSPDPVAIPLVVPPVVATMPSPPSSTPPDSSAPPMSMPPDSSAPPMSMPPDSSAPPTPAPATPPAS